MAHALYQIVCGEVGGTVADDAQLALPLVLTVLALRCFVRCPSWCSAERGRLLRVASNSSGTYT